MSTEKNMLIVYGDLALLKELKIELEARKLRASLCSDQDVQVSKLCEILKFSKSDRSTFENLVKTYGLRSEGRVKLVKFIVQNNHAGLRLYDSYQLYKKYINPHC